MLFEVFPDSKFAATIEAERMSERAVYLRNARDRQRLCRERRDALGVCRECGGPLTIHKNLCEKHVARAEERRFLRGSIQKGWYR